MVSHISALLEDAVKIGFPGWWRMVMAVVANLAIQLKGNGLREDTCLQMRQFSR